jgi:hypothetical protein
MSDSAETTIKALTEALTAAIAAAQPKKDVTFEEFIQRPENREPDLKRPVFQNGHPIQIKGASAATIRNLDNLKPGTYLDGLITVRIDGREPNETVHITYPCSTIDQRMRIYSRVSSFSDMVKKIAAEQARQEQGTTE